MKHRLINYSERKSFSLFYNDVARWFFLFLFFGAMFSSYLFGIQLALNYAIHDKFDFVYFLLTLFSGLGTVWGIMAHREFTKSSDKVKNTQTLAYRINHHIGKYEYKSYNPETHEFEDGYIPFGPIDFWDPATYAPDWVDKGKYWHVLLGLQVPNKELILQVVKDDDLIRHKKCKCCHDTKRNYTISMGPEWVNQKISIPRKNTTVGGNACRLPRYKIKQSGRYCNKS